MERETSQLETTRGHWSGRLGFILAAAGSAVGLGNLWKFPYISYENRGGAFVLIYLGAILLVGIPIMAAEVLLGRRTQLSPVGAFLAMGRGRAGGRAWGAVGALGVLSGFVILSYYSVVAGWTLHYILMAITGRLGELARDPAVLQSYFVQDFLADGRQQSLYHLLFMGLTVGAVYFGVQRGIERATKLMMPTLFLILLGLFVYSATTPHFARAIGFLFRPNFGELTPNAILVALGHAFFTLSLGMGCMLTYGSYMERKTSIPRSVMAICTLDTLVALMAAVVMFSIIFSSNLQISASATILFTTLPTVFARLPGGGLLTGLFYLLVAFAALTSTISLMEVVGSFAIDQLHWSRRRATLTMGSVISVFGLLNAFSLGASAPLSRFNPLGRASTVGVFSTLDYLAANWMLPLGGLLIALFVGWFLGRRDSRDELEQGHGRFGGYGLWRFLIRFVAPIAVGAIVVSVMLGAEYQ